jgi:CheY-like chemotaxis protein
MVRLHKLPDLKGGLWNTRSPVDSSIPTPIPLRPRSSPVPVAVAHIGSQALQIAARPQALIVDDCRFIAERVARVLEGRGFDCTITANGYEGLEQLRGHRFDLVVLDVDVPMVDGFSLLRRLRCDHVHTETPVLMLSTEPSNADRDRAVALGATGILRKPLQLRPLNQMLDSMVK